MKTIGFLGSDKNAGKTTALGFVAQRLRHEGQEIILCSIGINGEAHDTYEGTPKPEIYTERGDVFITNPTNLVGSAGTYRILHRLEPPEFSKTYCICEALIPAHVVLEGPNDRNSLLRMKKTLQALGLGHCVLLLDGSIDRQFMGHPTLCDSFYFSLLISSRSAQLTKAQQLLKPLQLPITPREIFELIQIHLVEETRSILLTKRNKLLYHGFDPPFMDPVLKSCLMEAQHQEGVLYLSGALTERLANFLSPLRRLTIVLDNFTQYLRVFTGDGGRCFQPRIELLHPLELAGIFLKEDAHNRLSFPQGIPVYNLFREDHHAIGISC